MTLLTGPPFTTSFHIFKHKLRQWWYFDHCTLILPLVQRRDSNFLLLCCADSIFQLRFRTLGVEVLSFTYKVKGMIIELTYFEPISSILDETILTINVNLNAFVNRRDWWQMTVRLPPDKYASQGYNGAVLSKITNNKHY